jgi:hypothetical protein
MMTGAPFRRAWGAMRHDLGQLTELMVRWFRHARRTFHVLIGLAFLFLAGAGGFVAFSEWRAYRENQMYGMGHFEFTAGFTFLLIILSLYSFVKARSVR